MEVLNATGNEYNLSPRKAFCGAKAGSTFPRERREKFTEDSGLQDLDWFIMEERDYVTTSDNANLVPSLAQLQYNYSAVEYHDEMCAIFFDTDRERSISSGLSYPFDRMNEGECIVHQELADSLAVDRGDMFFI